MVPLCGSGCGGEAEMMGSGTKALGLDVISRSFA